MASRLIVRNGTLVTSAGSRVADIALADGVISEIGDPGTISGSAEQEIDATGLHVLPGLIDGHVHFREPSLEHEETWLTGTRSAVMGGVTTVLEMPNTMPPTDTTERAREKRAQADLSAYCDFGLFGLLGPDVKAAIALARSGLVVGLKTFLGPTTGGLAAPDDEGLREALRALAGTGLRVAFHAEDRAIIEQAERELRAAGRHDALAHLDSRPPSAEVASVDRIGQLLSETRAAGHVLHLSSVDGLAAVERWRKAGVDLTCETSPHHVLLGRDVYALGGIARVNPPIRGEPHSAALLTALMDGRIDCLASDHAPHLAADKQCDSIWDVAPGFAGVETLLPLMLTEVAAGRLSLERLVYLTSEGPAQAWGMWPRKGSAEVGSDGDLTLVDLKREGTIRAADLHGKSNLSPYEGRTTRGAPVATIVRGQIVMRDSVLVGQPGWGRPVNRA